jgi:hypothetical protein
MSESIFEAYSKMLTEGFKCDNCGQRHVNGDRNSDVDSFDGGKYKRLNICMNCTDEWDHHWVPTDERRDTMDKMLAKKALKEESLSDEERLENLQSSRSATFAIVHKIKSAGVDHEPTPTHVGSWPKPISPRYTKDDLSKYEKELADHDEQISTLKKKMGKVE